MKPRTSHALAMVDVINESISIYLRLISDWSVYLSSITWQHCHCCLLQSYLYSAVIHTYNVRLMGAYILTNYCILPYPPSSTQPGHPCVGRHNK